MLALAGVSTPARSVAHALPEPGDLEERSTWDALIAWAATSAGELVLVSSNERGLPAASWTALQLRAVDYSNGILLHATEAPVCSHGVLALGMSCAWSSWAPRGRWHAKIAEHQRLFVQRKRLVYRLAVEGGLSVLQADTDTVWLTNPFPLLRAAPLSKYAVVVQKDEPWANGGLVYVDGRLAPRGSGAERMLREYVRALDTFSRPNPELTLSVRAIVPWLSAVSEKAGWMDEQNQLNDAVSSAALGRRVWVYSIVKLAVSSSPREWMRAHPSSRTGRKQTMLRSATSAVFKAVRRASHVELVPSAVNGGTNETAWLAAGSSAIAYCPSTLVAEHDRGYEMPMHPFSNEGTANMSLDGAAAGVLADADANVSSRLLISPPTIFAHVTPFQRLLRSCAGLLFSGQRTELLTGDTLAAGDTAPASTHARTQAVGVPARAPSAVPSAVVHLAGLSKQVRRIVLRSADTSGRLWARRIGVDAVDARIRAGGVPTLSVRGFIADDPRLKANAASADVAEREVILPLLELALCLQREPVLPRLPCMRQPETTPLRTSSRALLYVVSPVPLHGTEPCRYAWIGRGACSSPLLHEHDLADIEQAANRTRGGGVARVSLQALLGAESAEAAASLLGHTRAEMLVIDGGGSAPLSALALLVERVLEGAILPAATAGADAQLAASGRLPGCVAARTSPSQGAGGGHVPSSSQRADAALRFFSDIRHQQQASSSGRMLNAFLKTLAACHAFLVSESHRPA